MPIRDTIRRVVPSGPSTQRDTPDSPIRKALTAARARERELWFVVFAAMLVDVTLTIHGLTLGLTELNPIARGAIDAAGVLGLYALKAGALFVGGCCRLVIDDRYGVVVPVGLAVPSLVAVFVNAVLIAFITV